MGPQSRLKVVTPAHPRAPVSRPDIRVSYPPVRYSTCGAHALMRHSDSSTQPTQLRIATLRLVSPFLRARSLHEVVMRSRAVSRRSSPRDCAAPPSAPKRPSSSSTSIDSRSSTARSSMTSRPIATSPSTPRCSSSVRSVTGCSPQPPSIGQLVAKIGQPTSVRHALASAVSWRPTM